MNNKLFIVKERDDAMESALNQFELFTDQPVGAISVNSFLHTQIKFILNIIYIIS